MGGKTMANQRNTKQTYSILMKGRGMTKNKRLTLAYQAWAGFKITTPQYQTIIKDYTRVNDRRKT
jgi:hypothetical protein